MAKGKLAGVDVTAGQRPPSALAEGIGVADMIAPTPEGNGAVVANAADQMLYYYFEGMMAPMGTLSNYKRRPRALMVLDRSLSEATPGVYSVPVKLGGAGVFDVPVATDQPRLVNCFRLEVGASPDAKADAARVPLKVQTTFAGRQFKAGERVALGFRLVDAATGQPADGLKGVEVLVFEPPGAYEVTQEFPRAATYRVQPGFPLIADGRSRRAVIPPILSPCATPARLRE